MASLQRYTSHGQVYCRIVESCRAEGKPGIRVLAHLGKVDDILQLIVERSGRLRLNSFIGGAVCALHGGAQEPDMAGKINQVLETHGPRVQQRDGLTVGESLVAAMIGGACAPCRRRAFADWVSLPTRDRREKTREAVGSSLST